MPSSEVVIARIGAELKQQLQAQARTDGVPLSVIIRSYLEESARRHGHAPIVASGSMPQVDEQLRALAHRDPPVESKLYSYATIRDFLNARYVGKQPDRVRARLNYCIERKMIQRDVHGSAKYCFDWQEIHQQLCGGRCQRASVAGLVAKRAEGGSRTDVGSGESVELAVASGRKDLANARNT
jgi:hypothetical protein